jgi:hypothetical protein
MTMCKCTCKEGYIASRIYLCVVFLRIALDDERPTTTGYVDDDETHLHEMWLDGCAVPVRSMCSWQRIGLVVQCMRTAKPSPEWMGDRR